MPPPSHVDFRALKVSDLNVISTLGVGTFGAVRLVEHAGEYFALKAVGKQELVRTNQVGQALNEARILSQVRHPFIVELYMKAMDESRLYYLTEYLAGGELFTHHACAGRFPNDIARFYTAEVALALEYLHSKDIIHRDLKPENVVLDAAGHARLIDFGFAKKTAGRTFTLCGTPEYLAPECVRSEGHGKPADWWAFAVLLFELLAGYPPFYDQSPFRCYEKILCGKYTCPQWLDGHAKLLLKALLTVDPAARLTSTPAGTAALRGHAFYRGTDWDAVVERRGQAPIAVSLSHAGDTRYFDKYGDVPLRKDVPPQDAQTLFRGFDDF